MFENLVEVLKANPRKIVYTEGTDARILESAARLKQGGFLTPILVGNVDDVKAAAKAGNFDIEGLEIIDPANYDKMDEMAQCMFDLRKGKMTMEEVRANLQKGNYFGTMLVKMGVADALLGGATYSTADTVRPALQLIKTKKGAHLVSSCFIMVRGDEMLAMGDCAINIDYQDTVDKATGEVTFSAAQKLAEVAIETAKTAETFGIDPKVAMLSFSTKGSGKGGTVALSHDATVIAKELAPELKLDGEMQFDAAVSPVVGQLKFPGSPVAGHANTFIFPCIEAGNIGYKIAQRLGGFAAYGPILQGLNAPINDLSRGCDAEEVYRDLLIGDMSGPQIRGRARWEKRLSREEVLCTIEGVNNEERIPFVRRLFKNRNNSTFNDGASVILKEWKKMGGVYKGCRTCESSSRPVTCRQRHPAGRARGPSLHEERERLRHLSRPGSPSGGRWRRGLGVGPLPHGGGLLCDLRSKCERRTALAAHRQDAVLRARRGASLRLSPHPLRTRRSLSTPTSLFVSFIPTPSEDFFSMGCGISTSSPRSSARSSTPLPLLRATLHMLQRSPLPWFRY